MIRARTISVREAVRDALNRIEKTDPVLNAFVTVDAEGALRQADLVQRRLDAGEKLSPLAGVPAAVKDNICTEGIRTTCGSKMLGSFIPPYDAEAVSRMKAAGLVVIGKTNMDEFAMGSTSETSYFGAVKNPVNNLHVPGGSSGGSAAAVAAGMVPAAIGSDTGGSVRQPAAFCGTVGLKPTYGTVSRYGLVAYASSLDQIGPIAGSTEDCALLLDCISSCDPKDSTSQKRIVGCFADALRGDIRGLKIGIPREYFGEGLQKDTKDRILAAADRLREEGAAVEEFSLKLTEYAVPAYYMIASAEASSNLGRFDGVKYGYRTGSCTDLQDMLKKTRTEGFGEEVRRRILLGTFVLHSGYYDAFYLKALRARRLIRDAFDEAFSRYDLIISPVSPDTAPKLGDSLQDPLKMYLSDVYTVSANLAGLPGISVPVGKDAAGLPVGMQIIGRCFREDLVLRAAHVWELISGRT